MADHGPEYVVAFSGRCPFNDSGDARPPELDMQGNQYFFLML